jgi:hypothetical protein
MSEFHAGKREACEEAAGREIRYGGADQGDDAATVQSWVGFQA